MRLFLLSILLFFCHLLSAQKSEIKIISQDKEQFSSDSILRNLILEGVEILHVKTNFTSEDLCMGYFIDPVKYLGIEQGMILSTGSVDDVTKENSSSDYTSMGIDSALFFKYLQLSLTDSLEYKDSLLYVQQFLDKVNQSGDTDLSNEIEGLKTFDARVIEIEFIPTADTFYYRYVFASEEYDEYVCSPYNDIFAFYIYQEQSKKINTALVPIKNIPVSINNINNGNPAMQNCAKSNSYLYHKNDGNQNLVYDGFTKVLDIRFRVTPGERYYIKIAIADASDQILDSAVLIENNSIFSYFKSFEVYFRTESFKLEALNRMQKVLEALKKHPKSRVQLIGHSDITGPELHNLKLSVKRVEEVKSFLLENGISESRIIEKFKGELMPRYSQNWRNRRVEIFVLGE